MPGVHDRLVQLERLVKSIASKPNASSNLDFNSLSQPAEIPHLDTPIDGSSIILAAITGPQSWTVSLT